MPNKFLLLIWFSSLAFLMTALPAIVADDSRPDCKVCGMWIDQYRHTRHVFTALDGSQTMFCSLTCAAKYLKTHKAEMKQMQVADYLTAELIDTGHAIYLVGSDAPPVMSNTSVIAFSSQEQAGKFRQEHGGRLMGFKQVLSMEW